MWDVIIVGGGLAGLVNGIILAEAGIHTLLIEKKDYPNHRVCGEYISNEVRPFLERKGLFPYAFKPPEIRFFTLSSVKGKTSKTKLDLGGFGISRYNFDLFLYQKGVEKGLDFLLNTQVNAVKFENDIFEVGLSNGQMERAKVLIGAFGKKSKLDKVLDRDFTRKEAGYIGVKYHVRYDFPDDEIALHNFEDGYCGISKVEDDVCNVCYLGTRRLLKKYGSIDDMEKKVLCKNPFLKDIFRQAEFLFKEPKVINEVSFEPKSPVENHILMSGDAAGLITPLCGNGMAMAIHSAKLLSSLIIPYFKQKGHTRAQLENEYMQTWNAGFRKRLWVGRNTQKLFGGTLASGIAVNTMRFLPFAAKRIIKSTHGKVF